MRGVPERAQREYKLALDRRPGDPEILRRYAVSLGITGKWQDAEKLLDPLLRQSDKPAWRDRAFILAMNGRTKQAKDITQVTMPKGMRSEEHTSELQSLMRISYAVFCLKKKK